MVLFSGWIFYIKENSIKTALLPRFIILTASSIALYIHDPREHGGEKPSRRTIDFRKQKIEDFGRQTFESGQVLHVCRIFNESESSTDGKMGCSTAEIARMLLAAVRTAQEESDRSSGSSSGGTPPSAHEAPKIKRASRYLRAAARLKPHIFTHKGPSPGDAMMSALTVGDAKETTEWRIFSNANGLRFFEDVAASADNPSASVVKSEGVVAASADDVFELIMSTDPRIRAQWDPLETQVEVVESLDGHLDLCYSRIHCRYLKQWHHDRDMLYRRMWRRDQDGSYTVTQYSALHSKKPPLADVIRIEHDNPGSWDVIPLPASPWGGVRSLVRHTLELTPDSWGHWKTAQFGEWSDSLPCVALSRVAGIREYFGSHPTYVPVSGHRREGEGSPFNGEPGLERWGGEEEEVVGEDEFFDAMANAQSGVEEKELEGQHAEGGVGEVAKGVRESSLSDASENDASPVEVRVTMVEVARAEVDRSAFRGTLPELGSVDSGCWSDPGGDHYVIRGPTYLEDRIKVPAGVPLLRLLATDWVKSDTRLDHVATLSGSCAQTPTGKGIPFILVINLQVPGKPNYNIVFYFCADRPLKPESLLQRFADGSDNFRNARFKLIPRIVEGSWAVKRAVGTTACLLGKALTCRYLRQDNFLEVDVDIGSSSVARGVIGMVVGYITSLVIDMAVLIEAETPEELPEYLLGSIRVHKLRLEDAKSSLA